MAKALFGHVGALAAADARALSMNVEVRRLRARVAELEEQLERACRANEELHRAVSPLVLDDRELLGMEHEPALT